MGYMTASGSILRGIPMDECPCFLPDDNDNCMNCGKHVDLPDVPASLNLGDILGIVRLIDTTAKSYAQLIRENADPKNPALPRLRLIGGQLIRIPHTLLLKNLVNESYPIAKNLGYRGGIKRWGELIFERTPCENGRSHRQEI